MSTTVILFVDDDRHILELGATVLREAGYAVQSAANADIALVFLEQGLTFGLLITDVVLPGVFDGFALARRARGLRPGLPIIYTTGFMRVASIRAPGAPYGAMLAKPWRPIDLLRLVQPLLPHSAERVKNSSML